MTTIFQKKPVVLADKTTLVKDAIEKMSAKKIHHLVVMDGEDYFGMFSERHFFEATASMKKNILEETLESVCTKESESIDEDTDLSSALIKLSSVSLSALPVVNSSGKVVGIVTETDVLNVFDKLFAGETPSLAEKAELFMANNPLTQKLASLLSSIGF